METVAALALFIVTAVSMEIGILTWARAVLTSQESTKALHVLVFESSYRFFWMPKIACGLMMIAGLTFAFQIDSESDRTTFGIAALCLAPIFGGLVVYEAIRTKE